jgi:hypothetical protein
MMIDVCHDMTWNPAPEGLRPVSKGRTKVTHPSPVACFPGRERATIRNRGVAVPWVMLKIATDKNEG